MSDRESFSEKWISNTQIHITNHKFFLNPYVIKEEKTLVTEIEMNHP